jgi:hypothetical protein
LNVSAFASFSKPATSSGGADKCTTTTEGACTITECDLSALADAGGGDTDAGNEKAPNAGEIVLSGGDIAAPGISLTVESDGSYKPFTSQTKIFSTGQSLTAKAAGGDVPAFEKGVKVPAQITVTSPTCANGNCGDVDSTKALDLAWSNGGEGKVTAGATTLDAGKKSVAVSCQFDSAANKGTIPAAALGKLIKGPTTFVIGTAALENVAAGNYDVTVLVNGGGASGQATIK